MTAILRTARLRFALPLVLLPLAAAGPSRLAAQSPDNPLPAPNHTLRLGYYHVDAPRYGDLWHATSCYTDLYYAGMVDDYVCPTPNGVPMEGVAQWLPRMQASLSRASSQGKRILVDLALTDPSMMDQGSCALTAGFIQALDALAPFWNNVDLLELADEPPILDTGNQPCWTIGGIEATAASINGRLDQLGLPHRAMGISLGKSSLINTGLGASHPKNSPALGWIGVEAYLCSPTSNCGGDAFPQGSSDPLTNASILQSYLEDAKQAVQGKNIVFILQSYDRNGSWLGDIPAVTAMQWATYAEAYNDPRVLAINMFSYGRSGGTQDHPELNQPHRWIAERLFGTTFPGLCSTQPAIDRCTVSPSPLPAPTGLAANIFSSQVDLTWQDNSADETGFEIERQSSGGPWTLLYTASANSTYFGITVSPPAGSSVTYSYRVRAVRGAAASSYSNVVSATLWAEAPSVVPTAIGPSGCITNTLPTYQWSSVPKATRYYLTATRDDLESFFINDSNILGTSYPSPSALVSGVQYRWKVKACNNVGCSGYTPSIFFTPYCAPTQAPILSTPQGCTGSTQPTLSWSSVSGATQYKVAVYQVVDVSNDILVYYQDVPGTSFTPPSPLTPGQEYRFKVKAKAGVLDGPFSRHRYFTPQCAASQPAGTASPIAPWFATATPVGGTVTFTWEVASNATDYFLSVYTASGKVVHQQWYPASTACAGTECSVTPPPRRSPFPGLGGPLFPSGSYGWALQTKNGSVLGPWSPASSFTVP